jgi:hypothetical protein
MGYPANLTSNPTQDGDVGVGVLWTTILTMHERLSKKTP